MKFSERTLQILKNFSSINPSLFFKAGKQLRTLSASGTVLAEATIEETIETDFGVYDLSRFLAVLSLFRDPELTFDETYVTISDSNKTIKYVYADPITMVLPPDKTLSITSEVAQFQMQSEALTALSKGAGILQLPEIAFVSEDQNLYLRSLDSKNPVGNVYDWIVDYVPETPFAVYFAMADWKLLTDDYTVTIGNKFTKFESKDVAYFIAAQKHSQYGE